MLENALDYMAAVATETKTSKVEITFHGGEPLIAALKDEDSRVRWRAANALGRLGDHRAVDPLIATLKDESSLVRRGAADALESITKQDFGEDQAKWQQWWDEDRGIINN